MTTPEELRAALLDLGHVLALRAKESSDSKEIADLTRAAASALQAVSAADQKAAASKAMASMEATISAALIAECPCAANGSAPS